MVSWKDPQAFLESLNDEEDHLMVLGIDPGTKCGYAYGYLDRENDRILSPTPQQMGYWDLSLSEYDSGALRWVRLRQFLHVVQPDLVMIEGSDITASALFRNPLQMGSGIKSQVLLGCVRSHVAAWCEENNIPCGSVKISAVKKRATGAGNSSKEQMIEACNQEFNTSFGIESFDLTGADNVADAAFICQIALEEASKGLLDGRANRARTK